MKIISTFLSVLFFNLSIAQVKPVATQVLKNPALRVDTKIDLTPNNWSFENGLVAWTASGTAFVTQPTFGPISISKYKVPAPKCWDGTDGAYNVQSWNPGVNGIFWVGTGENRPVSAAREPLANTYISNTTGTLLSKKFILGTKKFISFLMMGKSAAKLCSVDIVIKDDGTINKADTIFTEGATQVLGNRVFTPINKTIINYPSIVIDGQNYIVLYKFLNNENENNELIRASSPDMVTGLNGFRFKRIGAMIAEKWKSKNLQICITDNDIIGYISVDDIRFENTISEQPALASLPLVDCPLQGIMDLHAHPMSNLGFGRKALHGAVDIGSIVPAGTNNCNPTPFRATTIDQALGSCNGTHGGYGIDNTCGDYIRAAAINYALDDNFIGKVPFERNPHGDHEHAGYPDFTTWPHHTTVLHQQMWIDWIRRAHNGGMKSFVALTVNNELLASIFNGDGPYDDKSVADVQIDEMKALVSRHTDFMEIAYSAVDYRRIIKAGKLAIILGMEVDKLGNFGKLDVSTNDAAVRSEIQRLYAKGVRYCFPIHLIDNSFGGTAVFSMLFNFANKNANGMHFVVKQSEDPDVLYNAGVKIDGNASPIGADNGLILALKGTLELLGGIPAPMCIDITCPIPTVSCCKSFRNTLNAINPTPELDVYKLIPGGHVNTKGLTSLGEVAINEMMKLGIMIDIDHMSDLSQERAVTIAENIGAGSANDYPLIMGHNAIRGTNSHTMKERSAPRAIVNRLAALGGMFGVGSSESTPEEFIANATNALSAMNNNNIAIGTDVNGFEELPRLGNYASVVQQEFNLGNFNPTYGKCRTGNKTWNYVKDGGVSHYGMFPEFFWDVNTNYTGGKAVMDKLYHSVENFAILWEKIERVKLTVR